MTGAPPVLDRPALWAALSQMQIEEPGTSRRFEEALADRNSWPLHFAERVADEYFGFLYLAATAGFEVTPSRTVDEAWHLHLEWPHYREVLCAEVLNRPIEHRAATGDPDDEERCLRQYEETLALYESVFGKPPPSDIWPRPMSAGEDEDELEATREQARTLSRRVAFASLVGSVGAVALGAPVVGAVLIGSALIFFLLGQSRAGAAAQDRRSGACGAGCGGSFGGDEDLTGDSDSGAASCGGGDSSCGGGCGGGGD